MERPTVMSNRARTPLIVARLMGPIATEKVMMRKKGTVFNLSERILVTVMRLRATRVAILATQSYMR